MESFVLVVIPPVVVTLIYSIFCFFFLFVVCHATWTFLQPTRKPLVVSLAVTLRLELCHPKTFLYKFCWHFWASVILLHIASCHVVNFQNAIVMWAKKKSCSTRSDFKRVLTQQRSLLKLWFLKFWVFSDRVRVCVDIPKDYVPVDGQTILFTTCHGSPIIFQKLAAKTRWHGPRSTVSKQGSRYEHIFRHSSL